MQRILIRVGIAVALVLLIGTSALAGRLLIPDPTVTKMPTQVLELGHDYDALVATLRALPRSPDEPTRIVLTAQERAALRVTDRVRDLNDRLVALDAIPKEAMDTTKPRCANCSSFRFRAPPE
jgi:hypothetical protein